MINNSSVSQSSSQDDDCYTLDDWSSLFQIVILDSKLILDENLKMVSFKINETSGPLWKL